MKVPPADFDNLPEELIDFKDDVTTILNYGKMQHQVLYETLSTPTWTGREGEQVIAYVSSAPNLFKLYHYYWLNSGWRYSVVVGTT